MRKSAYVAFVAGAAVVLGAQGFTDTPFLPGGKWRVHDANRPLPPVVTPGIDRAAPSDATVLFDGHGLANWNGGWTDKGDYFEIKPGSGVFTSRPEFGDCQIHLEFAEPDPPQSRDQGRGNSGVFIMGRYEIQILDCYENKTYADGTVGALYGMHPPLANAARKPGAWQTYDILFTAPHWADGKLTTPAYATVFLNGVAVQNHAEFYGLSTYRQLPVYEEHPPKGPIVLQDHGNPVRFRNIWVRNL